MTSKDLDLQSFFSKLLNRVTGLQAILITDRDGVTLAKEISSSYTEDSIESPLGAAFAIATEQASKLRTGKNKTITSFYEKKVIVHINHLPLIIGLIADSETANVGVLLAFVQDIKNALEPLRKSILEAEKENN